ncbi:potassium-transporting ATPase subunit KdpA [Dermabacter jinjuensis]|uniref:Potassium-transporting ATPase potassium-binding subunit n=1 Tax=Dermabacter jinjuensis TaxID=1667168 RepID=A0ABN5DLP6_9MICO|nr:potassium-transporting ATPase subunit KdpA [Dermabacter jinjuensis]ATH96068.1 potassium-transporting ATPase subunit KdpA [Dermabacter jinjuensis]UEB90140.1 potassium-transporting ATPase subunit KdpA [Dermabacter jinjuensis]
MAFVQILVLIAALVAVHRPLGAYMARTFTSERHLWPERLVYRFAGIRTDREHSWRIYLRNILAVSLLSVLGLYILQRVQQWLPMAHGLGPVEETQAWNTATSFVTNTNWQSYGGETTMSHLTQMLGMSFQNFISAAVGICVAIVIIRGIARHGTDKLGNFWVDLVRCNFRILLPIAFIGAILLIACGAIQNFNAAQHVHTLTGATQIIPGGPVASQEAIKELGTNGGGFFNANSAHPFENPNGLTNLIEIFLILLIPFALPRTYGIMVGDKRQGWAVLGAMAVLAIGSLVATTALQLHFAGDHLAAMEGKEARFGIVGSSLFATATTLTSTGAVDSMHSSYEPISGGVLIFNMLLGEIAPGGVGSGLYGMLVIAIMSVFISGLMVGRTPVYMGKRIGPTEVKLLSLYILVVPVLVLVGSAVAIALPSTAASLANGGPHGFSEVLYAFTSASNNNGSAFAGLNANTPFFNVALGFAMLLGRFLPMLFVLALAGKLAAKEVVATNSGTLRTHTPLFAGVMAGIALIVTGLSFLPTLALGPLAEGLMK